MFGENVIRTAFKVLHHIRNIRELAGNPPNAVWHDRQVRLLINETITLVRETCGSDTEVTKRLRALDHPTRDNWQDGNLDSSCGID